MTNLLPPPAPRAVTDDALSALMLSAFHPSHARSTAHGAPPPPPPATLFTVATAAAATAAAAAAPTPIATATADDARIPIPSSRSRSRARTRTPAPAPSAALVRDDATDSATDALSAAHGHVHPAAAAAAATAAALTPPSTPPPTATAIKVEPTERPCTPTEDEIDALEAEEIHTLGEIDRARKRVAIKTRQHYDIRSRLAAARKLFAQRQRQQREQRVRQLVEEKRLLGRQLSEE